MGAHSLSLPVQALLSAATGRPVRYDECPPPPGPDMAGLWAFLRAGGFAPPPSAAAAGGAVRAVAGRDPVAAAAWLAGLGLVAAAPA